MTHGVIETKYADYFEDKASLKQWARKQLKYKANEMRQFKMNIQQIGTESEVEVANKDSVTITQIGKTETNLQVISSAVDAGLEGAIITAHYLDQDLVQKTATIASAVDDMSGATDFDVAVTDFYCWDIENYGDECFTSSKAVGAGKTLSAGVAGTGYAEIAAAGVKGTKLKYLAVGTMWARSELNHADGVGAVLTLEYSSPIGGIQKQATCTLGANSTDEVVLVDSDGFPLQYAYGVRQFNSSKISTSDSGNFLLTDADCGNVDGSSNDVWGVIAEGQSNSVHTRYFVPNDGDVWLSEIEVINTQATLVDTYVLLTYTPKDSVIAKTVKLPIANNQKSLLIKHPIQLEPLTFVTMTLKGLNSDNLLSIEYIEAVSA
jgi:hypothetical protein